MTRAVRIGDTIAGKYRVERVLGTGGMGVVVAARHLEVGSLHAVKIMHTEPSGKPSWIHRFRREAQVGGRLRSDHAVRVFDVGGFDEGRPYIVMEHLEGTDLRKLLRARGRLPIAEAARFVAQACDAVAEAHDLGVIHRDLKPANLFVITGSDGSPSMKVLDFGISKAALTEDDEALRLTQTGEVFGSPAYMAPEQIRSFHSADPRSDVWALGVILYELLTGRWPFPGKASVEMIAMILEKPADPPSRHRPDLPPALEAVVLRCLEKDPAQRIPSARALRDALAPFAPPPARASLPSGDPLAGEDEPTLVHSRSSLLSLAPPAAPLPPPPEEVAVELVDVASPSGALTTSPPPMGMQHTLPLDHREGPSTRTVLLVAAGSIAILGAALVLLIHSAGQPATAKDEATATSTIATAGALPARDPPPATAMPSAADRPAETAGPMNTAAAPETAAPMETAAPSADPITASPSDPSARPSSRAGAVTGPVAMDPSASGGGGRHIDQVAALGVLGNAAIAAKRCKKPGGPTGSARIEVTFATSGRPSTVRVGGPFDGTPVGRCITGIFKSISVPPFEGSTFSAGKTVTIK